VKRLCYWYLFAILVVAIVIGAIRPLRVSPLYQVLGIIQFAAMAFAAWTLGARAIMTSARERRLPALAGIFLIAPFALLALLWVGLGPPWVATAAENQMRYLVLAVMTIAIVVGFVVPKRSAKWLKQRWLRGNPSQVGHTVFNAFGFERRRSDYTVAKHSAFRDRMR
jgi:hypothetical protein